MFHLWLHVFALVGPYAIDKSSSLKVVSQALLSNTEANYAEALRIFVDRHLARYSSV